MYFLKLQVCQYLDGSNRFDHASEVAMKGASGCSIFTCPRFVAELECLHTSPEIWNMLLNITKN